jgi:hypothetical protein
LYRHRMRLRLPPGKVAAVVFDQRRYPHINRVAIL